MNQLITARTRFAPSPTGRIHLGGARTALYDFLLARQSNGQFILRLEDTDQKRYVPGAEEELMRGLSWLGLEWDEGPDVGGPYFPYRQSERKEFYLEHARRLIESGHAYYCFCSAERLHNIRQEQMKLKLPVRYDGKCRHIDPDDAAARVAAGQPHVIRFKMPAEGVITGRDHLRGEITVENRNLDDYILIKSDGLAVYHLAAMVDDHLMNITHVIRGAEWLPTFPLHLHIIRALGWQEPIWIHPSVFLRPSGKGKMSKRESAELMKDGYSIFINDLKDLGYIPEGVVNWIVLMGWSYDDRTEFFTMDDLVEKFSIDRLTPSPAAINFSKLDHFNGLQIRNLDPLDLALRLRPFFEAANISVDDNTLLKVTPLIQERITTLDDVPQIAGFFFRDQITVQAEELVGKNMTRDQSREALQHSYQLLHELPQFDAPTLESIMRELAEQLNLKPGQLFEVLRMAIIGQRVSPPLFESLEIIGKEKSLGRIREAITLLQ